MKLIIPAAIERRLNAYVQGVNAEIAGMGELEMREDGNLWVTDIAIYDQEVTTGTADLSPQALAFFQTELIKAGRSPKNWRLWWHSHNNFGAFFSGTDTNTIAQSTEFDCVVSLVVNKKKERKCRIDYHRPVPMMMLDVPVEVAPEINAQTLELEEQIFTHMQAIEDLQKKRDEVNEEAPEGIAEEIAAKVRIKNTFPTWHPKGKAGKMKGDNAYLSLPFDDAWSKNKKKDGTGTTTSKLINALGRDEIELLLDETERLIRGYVANGDGANVECQELRSDLLQYGHMLDMLDTEEFGMVWDEQNNEWVTASINDETKTIQFDHVDDYEDDGFGLPRLAPPYRYAGFGRDDERMTD